MTESKKAGRPWVVANDEQNRAALGVPPDPGFSGRAKGEGSSYDLHDIRKATLWGTIMAGGAGVEYYFGYKLPQNDLVCEDFRSRDRTWDYCRIALDFFRTHEIPFWEMTNADALIGNAKNDNSIQAECLSLTTTERSREQAQYCLDLYRSGKPLRKKGPIRTRE